MKWLLIFPALALLFVLAAHVGKAIKRARIEQFGHDPDDEQDEDR